MPQERSGHPESGSILVLTALTLVTLLGVTALAVDLGYMYEMRNRMSAAADVAARSAAVAQNTAACVGNCATLTNFGRRAAALNGFVDGVDGVEVTINHPPVFG